jgi:polyisoprenoid-binding protein YceI
MKAPRLLLLCVAVLLTASLHAQQYKLSDDHSKVQFTVVNHLIFKTTVNGYFKGLKGAVTFDPKQLSGASVHATVNVSTISTGIGKRDRDLQDEDYFNAAKYPTMELRSLKITATDKPNTYQMTAALTIKGISKNISFPFIAVPNPAGCQFNATFIINRKDFNVGPDNPIDDKVTVTLSALAAK